MHRNEPLTQFNPNLARLTQMLQVGQQAVRHIDGRRRRTYQSLPGLDARQRQKNSEQPTYLDRLRDTPQGPPRASAAAAPPSEPVT